MKRRKFIAQAAAGAAAFTVIPRSVLGGKGYIAANDRVNLGYIGVGKQSYTLLENIGKCNETVVVAASDVFGGKLDLFIKAANKNNKSKVDAQVKAFKYYRELLEQSYSHWLIV